MEENVLKIEVWSSTKIPLRPIISDIFIDDICYIIQTSSYISSFDILCTLMLIDSLKNPRLENGMGLNINKKQGCHLFIIGVSAVAQSI
jgi:hypothetical protein